MARRGMSQTEEIKLHLLCLSRRDQNHQYQKPQMSWASSKVRLILSKPRFFNLLSWCSLSNVININWLSTLLIELSYKLPW